MSQNLLLYPELRPGFPIVVLEPCDFRDLNFSLNFLINFKSMDLCYFWSDSCVLWLVLICRTRAILWALMRLMNSSLWKSQVFYNKIERD